MMAVSVLGGLGYLLLIRRICERKIEYHSNNEDYPRPLGTESNIPYSRSGSDQKVEDWIQIHIKATQSYCKDKGYSVTVSVLNRDGVDILLARGDGTTGATVEVARQKA